MFTAKMLRYSQSEFYSNAALNWKVDYITYELCNRGMYILSVLIDNFVIGWSFLRYEVS